MISIDKEALRPVFERWAVPYIGEPFNSTEFIINGRYNSPHMQRAWEAFCGAFESLGEPVAYASAERPNALVSAAQFDSALPKRREEYSISLYRLPEVKA